MKFLSFNYADGNCIVICLDDMWTPPKFAQLGLEKNL
jgi:hypothetical protein